MRLAMRIGTASWKSVAVLGLVALGLTAGCATTKTENDDTTNTFVTVSESSTDIFSDVCIGTPDGICSAINDNAEATFVAQPKDLSQLTSAVQDVVFERYRVTYIRADGRNVPGVEVPYAFDGVANFRVPIDGNTVTRGFMIVRHQAKLESPLAELQNLGGSQVISVIAKVDFYGRDLAGRQLQVTAYYNITFGDFPE